MGVQLGVDTGSGGSNDAECSASQVDSRLRMLAPMCAIQQIARESFVQMAPRAQSVPERNHRNIVCFQDGARSGVLEVD